MWILLADVWRMVHIECYEHPWLARRSGTAFSRVSVRGFARVGAAASEHAAPCDRCVIKRLGAHEMEAAGARGERGVLGVEVSGGTTPTLQSATHVSHPRIQTPMDAPAANNHGGQAYVSPDTNSKLSQHSVTQDDEHDQDHWSGSSADEANRSQSGASKRKRPLSVSCETCKQRKVKCDRNLPACGWCRKNQSQVSR